MEKGVGETNEDIAVSLATEVSIGAVGGVIGKVAGKFGKRNIRIIDDSNGTKLISVTTGKGWRLEI